MLVIGKQLFSTGHVAGRAFQFNAVGAQIDIDVQAIFEHVEIFIARAEQGLDVRGEFNIFFHSGCSAASSSRTGLTLRGLSGRG